MEKCPCPRRENPTSESGTIPEELVDPESCVVLISNMMAMRYQRSAL